MKHFVMKDNDLFSIFAETDKEFIGISYNNENAVSYKKSSFEDIVFTEIPHLKELGNKLTKEIEFLLKNQKIKEKISGNIYFISGKARSGKDTFAKKFIEEFEEHVNVVEASALADPIKTIRPYLFPLSDPNSKNRDQLIFIGQSLRKDDETFWLKTWLSNTYKSVSTLPKGLSYGHVVTDVRQKNEVEFFKSLGGFGIKITALDEDTKFGFLQDEGKSQLMKNSPTETDIDLYDSPDFLLSHKYDTSFKNEVKEIFFGGIK